MLPIYNYVMLNSFLCLTAFLIGNLKHREKKTKTKKEQTTNARAGQRQQLEMTALYHKSVLHWSQNVPKVSHDCRVLARYSGAPDRQTL